MLDPAVHAAMITIIAWLLRLGAQALNIELGADIFIGLAGAIVTYILSLFTFGLYAAARSRSRGVVVQNYRPPFT